MKKLAALLAAAVAVLVAVVAVRTIRFTPLWREAFTGAMTLLISDPSSQ